MVHFLNRAHKYVFRDSFTHEENTFAVGTFLFRKLGRLGLMVNMHTFKDREESSNGKLKDDVSGKTRYSNERTSLF